MTIYAQRPSQSIDAMTKSTHYATWRDETPFSSAKADGHSPLTICPYPRRITKGICMSETRMSGVLVEKAFTELSRKR